MNSINEIKKLKINNYIKIMQSDLDALITQSKILLEKDTLISDKIRILQLDNCIFFQEMTGKREFLVRKMKDLNSANELMAKRMEIYEKMWDGCGCKVDYYS